MSIARKILMGSSGGKKSTYVDDVFSTYLYRGNETARSISNGVDNTKGGMVWIKNRDNGAFPPYVFDTERGVNKQLRTSSTAAQTSSGNTITAFNDNGFSLGTETMINRNNDDQVSWNFRKTKGFCDIVTYTGTGTNTNADGHLDINHLLGSVPGCIMVKRTGATSNWWVYHRGLGATKANFLQSPAAPATNSQYWNDTDPTASQFTVGNGLNTDGGSYVAYVFAGGASDEPGAARSVDFDGTGDKLSLATHADLQIGSSTYTIEFWVYKNADTPDDYDVWAAKGSNSSNTREFAIESMSDQTMDWYYATSGGSWDVVEDVSRGKIPTNQWVHICAQKDSSGYFSFFVNGNRTYYSTTGAQTLNTGPDAFCIGGYADANTALESNVKISNFRFVKGTAVYTSSFRPPTQGLADITNTKLLCCNKNTVTGSTVTPVTITAVGNPQSVTYTPFDDPAGFKFGEEGDQNIIKTGSYIGNSTANHEIYLGWEPQWWLVKNITDSQNWQLLDSMRGWVSDGNDQYLVPNNSSAESPFNFGNPTSTGFNLSNASSNWQNESGKTYVYVAIRRPDPLVGKPAEVGTDAFAMDTGSGSAGIPSWDSGFPVDMAMNTQPSSTQNKYIGARLLGTKGLETNSSNAETAFSNWTWDSNSGWNKGSAGSDWQSWMWKRGAGFDVVTYEGNGVIGHTIRHSMNKIPEMIWLKERNNALNWYVNHKDLTGGGSYASWRGVLRLNGNQAAFESGNVLRDASTSNTFTLGDDTDVNGNNDRYIAYLFTSVDGISKCGSYDGTGYTRSISFGFQPRFLILRKVSGSGSSGSTYSWYVLDTTRGWGSGNDSYMRLNTTEPAYTNADFGEPTSTGWDITNNFINTSGDKYIYYAHA